MKKQLMLCACLAILNGVAVADIVYITARPTPAGTGANGNGSYSELIAGSDTSAKSAVVDAPPRDGERFFSSTAFANTTNTGLPFLRLTPTLGVPGAVYQVEHSFSSTAGNTSGDGIVRMSNAAACTLSWTTTDKFQRQFGAPSPQTWKLLGYLTNDVGSATPAIEVYLVSGTNFNSTSARFPVDVFKFTLAQPCLSVPTVGVTGPLSTNVNQVVVTGVSATATNVRVYQDSGAGMVLIGSKLTGVTVSNNTVTVSGLVKGAQVAATQTINGQEGCTPTAGILVGGGANPRIRLALSLRETSSTGPVGTAGITTNVNLHFLGASGTSSGAPIDGVVVNPAAGWQTVTFDRGSLLLGGATNIADTLTDGPGYNANDTVKLRIFAYQTGPVNSIIYYSAVAGQSTTVTSNDTFTVNWTWDPVDGAEGYRLLRDVNGTGFTNDFVDVGANNFSDNNSSWTAGAGVVTPAYSQTNASIQWNPSVGNANHFGTDWAILDAIALTIDDTTDVGPFDLYIDNLANGTNVWQTFEGAVSGTTDFGFRTPSFSGTTSANVLTAPDQATVSNGAADTGTKSLRVRFQWSNTNATRWIRLTTSGVGNPQMRMDQPISFRMLLLPVNTVPIAPPAPILSIAQVGANQVLTWTNAHRLQAATFVSGTYTNTGVILAPWTNNLPEPNKFFRLAD